MQILYEFLNKRGIWRLLFAMFVAGRCERTGPWWFENEMKVLIVSQFVSLIPVLSDACGNTSTMWCLFQA
jgi:hypothetical protein